MNAPFRLGTHRTAKPVLRERGPAVQLESESQ